MTQVNSVRRRVVRTILSSAILGSGLAQIACTDERSKSTHTIAASDDLSMDEFIRGIPKAESHVHIPGCVTPELLLKLARRNGVDLPYRSTMDVEQFIENSYGPDLSDFIVVLDQIASVLRTDEDYYDTTYDYLSRSAKQNVRYVEAYIGPQFALENGLSVVHQLDGLNAALREAKGDFDIDAQWIMSFRRDRPVDEALEILNEMDWRRHNVVGVALSELDTPNYPQRFKPVFDLANQQGLKRTTHVDVGENDALARIWSAVSDLEVDGRIDHGIDGLDDARFVEYLRESGFTLAVCPTLFFNKSPDDSAYFRGVCDATKFMLDNDLRVTLNTDDPGIFDLNYLADIYQLARSYLDLSETEITTLAKNSFEILWIDQDRKDYYLKMIDSFGQL